MMTVRGHDPLCPIARETWCIWDGDKCARCALIARIREDERGKQRSEWVDDLEGKLPNEFDRGYEQGQRDEREACIAAVEATREEFFVKYSAGWHRFEHAIAAIRAREEKP